VFCFVVGHRGRNRAKKPNKKTPFLLRKREYPDSPERDNVLLGIPSRPQKKVMSLIQAFERRETQQLHSTEKETKGGEETKGSLTSREKKGHTLASLAACWK